MWGESEERVRNYLDLVRETKGGKGGKNESVKRSPGQGVSRFLLGVRG